METNSKRRPPSIHRGDDPYPCTIVRARYGGVYSDARWHAWGHRPHEIPTDDAYGSDPECMRFWGQSLEVNPDAEEGQFRGSMRVVKVESDSDTYWIGKGGSPEEALQDLIRQIEENETNG